MPRLPIPSVLMQVKDFGDPADVQKAVNRIQPEAETRAIVDASRAAGFRSVSVDLIYGLPLQTTATMKQTLDKVIAADPDRIAVYHYAHMPHLFKPQRRINEAPTTMRLTATSCQCRAGFACRWDCVLLGDVLVPLADATTTAHETMKVIRQNLAWATVYNLAAIPAAACGLLNPWLSGVGMAASSALVVANALRLRKGN